MEEVSSRYLYLRSDGFFLLSDSVDIVPVVQTRPRCPSVQKLQSGCTSHHADYVSQKDEPSHVRHMDIVPVGSPVREQHSRREKLVKTRYYPQDSGMERMIKDPSLHLQTYNTGEVTQQQQQGVA